MNLLRKLFGVLVFVCVAGGGLMTAVPGHTLQGKLQWLGQVRKVDVADLFRDQVEPTKLAKSTRVDAKTAQLAGTAKSVNKKHQAPSVVPKVPESEKKQSEDLRVVTDDQKARAIEKAVFEAMNEARRAHGLPELAWFEPVAKMARLKAREVLETGEFSHMSKRYGLYREMYDKAGLQYTAGTEISAGSSVMLGDVDKLAKKLVDAWLGSPAHRRAVLGQEYEQVGVGVAYANRPVRVVRRDCGGTAFGFALTGTQVVEADALFITLTPESKSGQ